MARQSTITAGRASQSGFTLLELLVVVVIIGIMLGFASLSVGINTDNRLEQAARRFTAVVKLANEEAIISGQDMVLRFSKRNYEFGVYALGENNQPQWAPVEADDPALRAEELDEDISMRLILEGEEFSLGTEKDDDERPGLLLLASGEMTPFQVTFVNEEGVEMLVEGDTAGNVFYRGKQP